MKINSLSFKGVAVFEQTKRGKKTVSIANIDEQALFNKAKKIRGSYTFAQNDDICSANPEMVNKMMGEVKKKTGFYLEPYIYFNDGGNFQFIDKKRNIIWILPEEDETTKSLREKLNLEV